MTRDTQLAANLHRINALMLRVIQVDVALTNMRVQRDEARAALREHCPLCGTLRKYGGKACLWLPMQRGAWH